MSHKITVPCKNSCEVGLSVRLAALTTNATCPLYTHTVITRSTSFIYHNCFFFFKVRIFNLVYHVFVSLIAFLFALVPNIWLVSISKPSPNWPRSSLPNPSPLSLKLPPFHCVDFIYEELGIFPLIKGEV